MANVDFEGRVYRRFFIFRWVALFMLLLALFMVKQRLSVFFIVFVLMQFVVFYAAGIRSRMYVRKVTVSDDAVSFGSKQVAFSDLGRIELVAVWDNTIFRNCWAVVFYDNAGKKLGGLLESNFRDESVFMDFINRLFQESKRYDFSLTVACDRKTTGDSADRVRLRSPDLFMFSELSIYLIFVSSILLIVPVVLGFTDRIVLDVFLVGFLLFMLLFPFIVLWYLFMFPRYLIIDKDGFCIGYRLRKVCIPPGGISSIRAPCLEVDGVVLGAFELVCRNGKVYRFGSARLKNPCLMKAFTEKVRESSRDNGFEFVCE